MSKENWMPDLLGIMSEADLKLWAQIQRVKASSNERPELDVKQHLHELSMEYYRRTGANGY